MSRKQKAQWKVAPFLVTLGVFVGGAAAVIGTVMAGQDGAIGPDIVVSDLYDTKKWGTVGDKTAYSVATESCNRGDEDAQWVSGSNEHPVIGQNLYRLKDGRFEQLGMSWLKHGFYALALECDNCQNPGTGALLGVGCADPYSADLNGAHSRLGPRSPVNAFTGEFPYPFQTPAGTGDLDGRIQVENADIDPALNPSALYFVEGHYITADDATRGNGLNNASYREVTVGAGLDLFFPDNVTYEAQPAIYAWKVNDAAVTISVVQVPDEGIFHVAFKATSNGDGTWRYEYAVHNMNSHRSGQSFSVPILPGTVITNAGFRDVDYHSGEPFSNLDWSITVDDVGGSVTWATEDFATNENANALRWGTMYNFWFDADVQPSERDGLDRPLQTRNPVGSWLHCHGAGRQRDGLRRRLRVGRHDGLVSDGAVDCRGY